MRIPVCQADVDAGRVSDLAKKLQQHWPPSLAPAKLSEAQRALAVLLGYRDVHDLQAEAKKPPQPPLAHPHTVRALLHSMAWRAHLKLNWPLAEAQHAVDALRLSVLGSCARIPLSNVYMEGTAEQLAAHMMAAVPQEETSGQGVWHRRAQSFADGLAAWAVFLREERGQTINESVLRQWFDLERLSTSAFREARKNGHRFEPLLSWLKAVPHFDVDLAMEGKKPHVQAQEHHGYVTMQFHRRFDPDQALPMFSYDQWGTSGLKEKWHPLIPELVKAGMPPYRFAVLADGSVFSWPKMLEALEQVPQDAHAFWPEGDLHPEWSDEARRAHFIVKRLMPDTLEPIEQALQRGWMPSWLKVVHVHSSFEGGIERLSLLHVPLGGLLPVVHQVERRSDPQRLSKDVATLVCEGRLADVNVPDLSDRRYAFVSLPHRDVQELTGYFLSRHGQDAQDVRWLKRSGIALMNTPHGPMIRFQPETVTVNDVPHWLRTGFDLEPSWRSMESDDPQPVHALEYADRLLERASSLATRMQDALDLPAHQEALRLAADQNGVAVHDFLMDALASRLPDPRHDGIENMSNFRESIKLKLTNVGDQSILRVRQSGLGSWLTPSITPMSMGVLTMLSLGRFVSHFDEVEKHLDISAHATRPEHAFTVTFAMLCGLVSGKKTWNEKPALAFNNMGMACLGAMLIDRAFDWESLPSEAILASQMETKIVAMRELARVRGLWLVETQRLDALRKEGRFLYAETPLPTEIG